MFNKFNEVDKFVIVDEIFIGIIKCNEILIFLEEVVLVLIFKNRYRNKIY